MNAIVKATGLTKTYGQTKALDNISFSLDSGKIIGLIGPNGAGKTTVLNALLGLISIDGDLQVMGLDPRKERSQLMQNICFIADVAVLPRWLKVKQAVDFVAGVHPRFNKEKALAFLSDTKVDLNQKVKELSKGMIVQLHLALVMSIDANLLVLDEPTLGLDILYRKSFYDHLLNDYFDNERTILITTHQVEEVESILTDLIFIKDGNIILNSSMEELNTRFVELAVTKDNLDRAKALGPIYEREVLGRHVLLFDNKDINQLQQLGELHAPSVADLFVAQMKGGV